MKNIAPDQILLYYDYPQVFLALDAVGTRFVCMATSETDSGPGYTCLPISDIRAHKLAAGEIDLRTVFETPELAEIYESVTNSAVDEQLHIVLSSHTEINADLLPAPGIVFNYSDEVASKASELNATVSYVSLSVPEALAAARIKTDTLAEFLRLFQSALKQLTKLSARTVKSASRVEDQSFCTDVFGFSKGSFTVHLRSSQEGNIFGDNVLLSMAFSKLNTFLSLADTPDDAIAFLQEAKGHTASALIRLLTFFSENSCPVKHRWASPDMSISESSEATLVRIQDLVSLCKARQDLSTEEVVLVGVVLSASVETDTWKVLNEFDKKAYSGEVKLGSDITIGGITLESVRYRLYCEEVIEVAPATHKESKRLYLTRIEQLVD
jgi:hypothetical protein